MAGGRPAVGAPGGGSSVCGEPCRQIRAARRSAHPSTISQAVLVTVRVTDRRVDGALRAGTPPRPPAAGSGVPGTCPWVTPSRALGGRSPRFGRRSRLGRAYRLPVRKRSLSCDGSPGGAAVGGDPVGGAGPPEGAFSSGNLDRSCRPYSVVDHRAANQNSDDRQRCQYRCSAHDSPPPVGGPGAMGPPERDRPPPPSIPRVPRGRVVRHATGGTWLVASTSR